MLITGKTELKDKDGKYCARKNRSCFLKEALQLSSSLEASHGNRSNPVSILSCFIEQPEPQSFPDLVDWLPQLHQS